MAEHRGRIRLAFRQPPTGKPCTTVHKVRERLRAKAGLPHLRIHDLRDQYASLLLNNGRALCEVQQVLGHSDPIVTQRYAHLSSKALQNAAESASVGNNGAIMKSAQEVDSSDRGKDAPLWYGLTRSHLKAV